MELTPELLRDIRKIIRDHHVSVAAALFGQDAVTPEDWELAKRLGLVSDEDAPGMISVLESFGAAAARDPAAMESVTWPEFLESIKGSPVPQTTQEKHAAQWNARHGAAHITDLGDKVTQRTIGILDTHAAHAGNRTRDLLRDITSARFGDADAAQRVRDAGVADGLGPSFYDGQFRATTGRIASDMGYATGDWTRDLKRIATTEGHNAVNNGIANRLEAEEEEAAKRQKRPVRRLLAYKLPRPDACPHCLRLHVDGGGNPRLYWLDEIRANGTNVGRRAADWLIVIDVTHPWCGCTLHQVPSVFVPRITQTKGWSSGQSAPSVIGPGGSIV